MSKVSFTPEQLSAVNKSDKNLLVSASAGSGKTTVLIERILNKIKNNGWNVDELLIVTFTEAAAFELKQRLRVKLTQALLEDSSNQHLRMQLPKLANANISTFHSFCNQVIQKFFYLIDFDASYKISDDIEGLMIALETLEEMFEDCFECQDEKFLYLVNRFSRKNHDDDFKKLILDLYNKMRTIPHKDYFKQETLKHYQLLETLDSWDLYPLIKKDSEQKIQEAMNNFSQARQLAEEVNHPYAQLYQEDMEIINHCQLLVKESFDSVYHYLKGIQFVKFNSKTSEEIDETTKEMIKNFRDKGKEIITKDLFKKYYAYQEKSQVKFLKENKKVLEALFYVLDLFDKRFSQAKREENLVDFSDLEEMTLKIFSVNQEDNDATHYYKNLFKEILIDEFQDTNSMQETIINPITNGKNLFMVGDVKQSIYRFRSAEPDIFQRKYKNFQNNDGGELINLNANYRSRNEVLQFINYLFYQLMDEEIGEIQYDEKASLIYGQKGYSKEKLAGDFIKVNLLEKDKINEDRNERLEKNEIEAIQVAKEIRKLMDNETLVYDLKEKVVRRAQYKDIVILSRTKNDQEVYNEVFKRYHIPFLASDLSGYFDSIEVLTIVSILKVIDNPLQDIPLVAALRSPIFNINEKELIRIKIHSKKDYYYDKILDYLKSGEDNQLIDKLRYFVNLIDEWRESVKNESLSELLFHLYHDTNYYDFVLGQVGGKQRQANLDLLFERAKLYENLTSNSLFKFIQLVNFLKDNDKDLSQARTVSDNEDLVRFMSIHKSKGLEFPIVFVTNLSKLYNTIDEKAALLFDKDLGITFSYFDMKNRVHYETLYQTIIKNKMHQQMLAEEMRLLYVALTRAKERIYLIGTVNDFEKEIIKVKPVMSTNSLVLPADSRKVTNYLALILLALARSEVFGAYINENNENRVYLNTDEPQYLFEVISSIDDTTQPVQDLNKLDIEMKEYTKLFSERLNYIYPYQEKTMHFAKQTIADMKRMNQTSDYSFQFGTQMVKTPKFVDINKANATLRGTTYHRFMQHIDYKKEYLISDLEVLKEQLIKKEIFTQEELNLIDLYKISDYLNQAMTKDFKTAQRIYQELPFTTLINSQKVYDDLKDDVDILVQGVIDLFIVFEHHCVLIDFKTDLLSDSIEDITRIKKQYQVQLSIYQEAMKNIYPDKTIEGYLYLFQINQFLKI